MANGTVVLAAVEGIVDEAVVRRLLDGVGGTLGDVYGKQGKSHLRQRIGGYNHAARNVPWVVLVDLDSDDCAPPLRSAWLPQPSLHLCFRVAVREVEAWLMADAERIAQFLRVRQGTVPSDPEGLDDPKAAMVNLARVSRSRDIREDMVPRPGSGRQVGPAYSTRLIEFVSQHWRPDVAADRADSLGRAIRSMKRLVQSAP